MKSLRLFLLCCLSVFLWGCGNNSHNNPKDENTKLDLEDTARDEMIQTNLDFDIAPLLSRENDIVKQFPNSSNSLAFDLYRELSPLEGNLAFSPLSISAALAMAYAGSKEETQKAFKKNLYFGNNTLDFHKAYGDFVLLLTNKDRAKFDTTIEIANTVWLQKDFPVLNDFKSILADAYKAQSIQLDFKIEPSESTAKINRTISNQTHGEIDQLLKNELSTDTRLVLTNALYFRSQWQFPFDINDTNEGNFTLEDGRSTNVRFMRQVENFPYGEDEQKQFLLIGYKDQEFATLFVLPREGELQSVENNLSDGNFKEMLNS